MDVYLQRMPKFQEYRSNTKRRFRPVSTQKQVSERLNAVVEVDVESNSYFNERGQSVQGWVSMYV